jgi:hypothetical protein
MSETSSSGLGIQVAGSDTGANPTSPRTPQITSSYYNTASQDMSVPIKTSVDVFADELREMPAASTKFLSNDPHPFKTDYSCIPQPLKLSDIKQQPTATRSSNDHRSSSDDKSLNDYNKLSEDKKDGPEKTEPKLIMRQEVIRQIDTVDEWLQKRKLSRELFQDELKRLSEISFNSEPISPSNSISTSPISPRTTASPGLLSSSTFTESPIQTSRPKSSLLKIIENADTKKPPVARKEESATDSAMLETRNFAVGRGSGGSPPRKNSGQYVYPTPGSPVKLETHALTQIPVNGPEQSRSKLFIHPLGNHSVTPEEYESALLSRSGSGHPQHNPELRMFQPPDSPPLSQGHQSAGSGWDNIGLAETLKTPGYGEGVEDGIQVVVTPVISDPGLMLVNEDTKLLTPAVSIQSMDYAIRHDSSFYKYGGFCDGAKMTLRGAGGAMKELKRPGVSKDPVTETRLVCL